MKIAIDARIMFTSTGRYVERLIHYLQELDKDNQYVVLLLKKDFDRWQPAAPNFTKAVADYPMFSPQEQLPFARQLYSLRADLVHFTMPQQPVLYFRRHVTTIHDLTLINFRFKRRLGLLKTVYKNWVKPGVFRVVLYWFAHSSAHIIVPSQYVREQVKKRLYVPDRRLTVTYEGAEIQAAQPKPFAPLENKTYIMYAGNSHPHKNLPALVEAFIILQQQHLDLWLALPGREDYFYEQLQKLVAERGCRNILFPGFVPQAELEWLYQNARAYVFPSLSEGFGLPGLEAMAHGTPVVSSNATSLPEIHGDAAHYFDPNDSEDMAAKIAEVLDDDQLRQRLIAAGYERVKQFSWRRMAEQTLEVYENVLKST